MSDTKPLDAAFRDAERAIKESTAKELIEAGERKIEKLIEKLRANNV